MVKRVRLLVISCGLGAPPSASGHQKKTFLLLSARSRMMEPEAFSYALAMCPGKALGALNH